MGLKRDVVVLLSGVAVLRAAQEIAWWLEGEEEKDLRESDELFNLGFTAKSIWKQMQDEAQAGFNDPLPQPEKIEDIINTSPPYEPKSGWVDLSESAFERLKRMSADPEIKAAINFGPYLTDAFQKRAGSQDADEIKAMSEDPSISGEGLETIERAIKAEEEERQRRQRIEEFCRISLGVVLEPWQVTMIHKFMKDES